MRSLERNENYVDMHEQIKSRYIDLIPSDEGDERQEFVAMGMALYVREILEGMIVLLLLSIPTTTNEWVFTLQ